MLWIEQHWPQKCLIGTLAVYGSTLVVLGHFGCPNIAQLVLWGVPYGPGPFGMSQHCPNGLCGMSQVVLGHFISSNIAQLVLWGVPYSLGPFWMSQHCPTDLMGHPIWSWTVLDVPIGCPKWSWIWLTIDSILMT